MCHYYGRLIRDEIASLNFLTLRDYYRKALDLFFLNKVCGTVGEADIDDSAAADVAFLTL